MTYLELELIAYEILLLTGYDMNELLSKFKTGWTLQPPDPPKYDEMTKLAVDEYTPVCPRGYIDCVMDPAYIKFHYPKWYSELYGDLTPEQAIHVTGGCVERFREDPNEEYYCYDDEDK